MTEQANGSTPLTPGAVSERLEQALFEIRRVIAGQDQMLERVLVCLLAQGHLLIEGVPGLAKTLTIKTTAGVLGGSFARVQFTPDLVPADLVGTRVFRPDQGSFDTELGPVFCNFLLADEINRAPAKVQSALLEVMQERQVTIAHTTYPVPEPFLVMATQNPIESEGTYPLPEAQVDRFMLKILIDYPEHDEELTIVQRQLVAAPELREALSLEELKRLQAAVFGVYVDPSLVSYSVGLATATREPAGAGLADLAEYVEYGASPRGPISVVQAARALALLRGRDYVTTEDIRALAKDALRHRLVLSYQALAENVTADAILERVLAAVPVPEVSPVRPDGRMSDGLLLGKGTPERPGPGALPVALLRALQIEVGRRLEGMLAGDYRSSRYGEGSELAQVRPYAPGDDVRKIEWNVTARTGTPHVRVHLAERVLVTWLVLDTSPSMEFGTADRRKADVADGVALAVGHVGTRRGNRLGVLTFGGREPKALPPAQGRHGLVGLLAALKDGPEQERVGATSLGAALARTGAIARQRGLVVVVSDFRGPLDWRKPLLELLSRHDVLAVEIRDPREQELPDVGEVWLMDPETGRQVRVDTRSSSLRERFAVAAAEERTGVARVLSALGVPHVVLSTRGDWLRAFAVFLGRRR